MGWDLGTLEPNQTKSITVAVMFGSAAFGDPNVWNTTRHKHYTSIQAAINDPCTLTGDEIMAYPALYKENVDFNSVNSKVLTLKSSDPNDPSIVAQTIIKGSGSDAVTFTNNNSVINGFTITNSSNGIYCYGSSSSPTIKSCIIKNNSRGIYCLSAGQTKIMNNWIVNNGSYGVYVERTAADAIIRNNTISSNPYGGIRRYARYAG